MIKSFPKKYILYQTNDEMTKDEKNEVAGPRPGRTLIRTGRGLASLPLT